MQEYMNFHVVIIDDQSEDNTSGLIKAVLESQTTLPPERYEVIVN
jgi:glycosyltransferase involved in cell wall biosynthesis